MIYAYLGRPGSGMSLGNYRRVILKLPMGNKCRLTLDCGHHVFFLRSRYIGERAHCPECKP